MTGLFLHDPVERGIFDLLVQRCAAMAPSPGRHATGINRLHLVRFDASHDYVSFILQPSICFYIQGICENDFASVHCIIYSRSYSIIGAQLPIQTRIIVQPGRSFLALVLNFDLEIVKALCAMAPRPPINLRIDKSGLSFGSISVELSLLLLDLLDCQYECDTDLGLIPPAILNLYRFFLALPQGELLWRLAATGMMNVTQSITWLNDRYREDVSVSNLAAVADMPLTSYHRHFKALTSLSPLQYIKLVRLFEARRLMLFYGKTATQSCLEVGYESASQFNREYKRFFCQPPHKDVRYTLRYNAPIYQPLRLNHPYLSNRR
ncbi:MAG: AraC family transcriptional regulator [Deltaproteobacteria bacterium]|jgi:AraC-like DNA-binding protein|nr:AraC family transcriptional regulator [Deltaproteobacteria bacterium]